jgi:hypothetical protein
MAQFDLTTATWRTSSYSGSSGGDCIELAHQESAAAIRDSKHRTGAALVLPAAALTALVFTTRTEA